MKKPVLLSLILLFSTNLCNAQFLGSSNNNYTPLSGYSSATLGGGLITALALFGTLWIVNDVELSFEAPIATQNYNDGHGTVYNLLPYGGNINMVYSDPNSWFFLSGLGTMGYGSSFENPPKNTKFYVNGNIGVGCSYALNANPNFYLGGTLICSPVFLQEAELPMPDFYVRMYVEGAYQDSGVKGFIRLGSDQTGAVRLSVGFRTK